MRLLIFQRLTYLVNLPERQTSNRVYGIAGRFPKERVHGTLRKILIVSLFSRCSPRASRGRESTMKSVRTLSYDRNFESIGLFKRRAHFKPARFNELGSLQKFRGFETTYGNDTNRMNFMHALEGSSQRGTPKNNISTFVDS